MVPSLYIFVYINKFMGWIIGLASPKLQFRYYHE